MSRSRRQSAGVQRPERGWRWCCLERAARGMVALEMLLSVVRRLCRSRGVQPVLVVACSRRQHETCLVSKLGRMVENDVLR